MRRESTIQSVELIGHRLPRGLNVSLPLLQFDNGFIGQNIAGVDEVGLGAAAGPIVSAATIFRFSEAMWVQDINDSKKLAPQKREMLAEKIIERAVAVGIGIASVVEIEKHGLGAAHKTSLQRAIDALKIEPDMILIDGNLNRDLKYRGSVKTTQWIVKGDGKSMAIAAASIVAKVFRDGLMKKLGDKFPGYGWSNNVGYRTKGHYESIEKLGLTSQHRRNSSDMAHFVEEESRMN